MGWAGRIGFLALFVIIAGLIAIYAGLIDTPTMNVPKVSLSGTVVFEDGTEANWPPQLNEYYPDLHLRDHHNRLIKLSDLRGRVIIIEPIGMNCPACNAFSGAHKKGGYQGTKPQSNLFSFEQYLIRHGKGIKLNDPGIVFIQLLLYDMKMEAPSQQDAALWAKHFGLDQQKNVLVLAGNKSFINKASYNLIPGFQLIDKNFVLRVDSTGHYPEHDLLSQLIPYIKTLVDTE